MIWQPDSQKKKRKEKKNEDKRRKEVKEQGLNSEQSSTDHRKEGKIVVC